MGSVREVEGGVTWRVHRARETPVRTLVVSVFILGFLIFSLWAFGPLLLIVAGLVLFAATHTYFLPVTYTLNRAGVTIDKGIFSYSYEWGRFRRFFRTSGGVVLSPFEKPGFLDNFRGVHLLLPQDAAVIITYLEKHFSDRGDVS